MFYQKITYFQVNEHSVIQVLFICENLIYNLPKPDESIFDIEDAIDETFMNSQLMFSDYFTEVHSNRPKKTKGCIADLSYRINNDSLMKQNILVALYHFSIKTVYDHYIRKNSNAIKSCKQDGIFDDFLAKFASYLCSDENSMEFLKEILLRIV